MAREYKHSSQQCTSKRRSFPTPLPGLGEGDSTRSPSGKTGWTGTHERSRLVTRKISILNARPRATLPLGINDDQHGSDYGSTLERQSTDRASYRLPSSRPRVVTLFSDMTVEIVRGNGGLVTEWAVNVINSGAEPRKSHDGLLGNMDTTEAGRNYVSTPVRVSPSARQQMSVILAVERHSTARLGDPGSAVDESNWCLPAWTAASCRPESHSSAFS